MAHAKTHDRATPRQVAAPVVGVTACLDAGQHFRPGVEYWYLNRRYTAALREAGAVPVILSPDMPVEVCLRLCAGVVLSGGGDLPESFESAALEREEWAKSVPGEAEALERIAWERRLLDAFAANGRSVLGVCFGMQLMNLHFGGTLHSDLARRTPPAMDHGTARAARSHAVCVSPDSSFFRGWAPPAHVSSSHRQAVARVAPGFTATAWAEDGVIEAMENGPLIGVEWHPESDASAPFIYGRWIERLRDPRGRHVES